MSKRDLAAAAAKSALRSRLRAGVTLTQPANPVELAERIGAEVWFKHLPSLEGMLIREEHPVILLSSLRPAGRVMFTCAHELGHLLFDHDSHLDVPAGDEELFEGDPNDEYQANMFASYLLMPKTLVQYAFSQRKLQPGNASPIDVLRVSQWLGVGYSSLIHHLRLNLRLIGEQRSHELLSSTPKGLLTHRYGDAVAHNGLLIDEHWRGRGIDLAVGQTATLPSACTLSGACTQILETGQGSTTIKAVAPGMGHIEGGSGWTSFIRVQRSRFEGRSIFRFQEEANDEI